MLNYSTIYPLTLTLLKRIQSEPSLKEFILVGGTSLALQIGHRHSIDLDLFCYSDKNIEWVFEYINGFGNIKLINQNSRVLNLFIDNIKVDFVSYQYDFIDTTIRLDGLNLASMRDIPAMKLVLCQA